MAQVYENRVVLFADILGWKQETAENQGERLLEALSHLGEYGRLHNESIRRSLKSGTFETEDGVFTGTVNPRFLEVQYAAFSDNFAFSMPADFGPRILTSAAFLMRQLLRMGLLLRGGVTSGQLYHKDSAVFGPALIEAVAIEQTADAPRILISPRLAVEWNSWPPSGGSEFILDQFGDTVLNPFDFPFAPASVSVDVVQSFVEENYFFGEIKSLITTKISAFESAGNERVAAKWRYFRDFIEGPVLEVQPFLRQFWDS